MQQKNSPLKSIYKDACSNQKGLDLMQSGMPGCLELPHYFLMLKP